jgi:hypothetical protein
LSKKRRKRKRRPPAPQAAVSGAESGTVAKAPERRAVAGSAKRGRPADERPPAPWGSFPLVEVAVLVGIVLAVIGLVIGGSRGPVFIVTGLALGSIGGLELSIREHFAGYRSHSALLAGIPALIVLGVLFYAGPDSLPPLARVGVGAAVFAAAFYLLAADFRRRAGVAFKLR